MCGAALLSFLLQVFRIPFTNVSAFFMKHQQCNKHSLASHSVSWNIALLQRFHITIVQHLVQLFTEYEECMRRMPYVPRFSYGRRMLRDEFCPNRFFLAYLFCYKTMAIEFLKDVCLLRIKVQCNTCDRDMTWSAKFQCSWRISLARWKEGCWGQVQSVCIHQARVMVPAH